jgi:hypothetical protein
MCNYVSASDAMINPEMGHNVTFYSPPVKVYCEFKNLMISHLYMAAQIESELVRCRLSSLPTDFYERKEKAI